MCFDACICCESQAPVILKRLFVSSFALLVTVHKIRILYQNVWQGCWHGSGSEELIRSVSAIQKSDNLANNMEANT